MRNTRAKAQRSAQLAAHNQHLQVLHSHRQGTLEAPPSVRRTKWSPATQTSSEKTNESTNEIADQTPSDSVAPHTTHHPRFVPHIARQTRSTKLHASTKQLLSTSPPTWAASDAHTGRTSYYTLSELRAEAGANATHRAPTACYIYGAEDLDLSARRETTRKRPLRQVLLQAKQKHSAETEKRNADLNTSSCRSPSPNPLTLDASNKDAVDTSGPSGHADGFDTTRSNSEGPKSLEASCANRSTDSLQEDDLQEETTQDLLDEEEIPDADVLRDQLEWDLGVAEALYTLKALQINEQIAMERRQRHDTRRAGKKGHKGSKSNKSLTETVRSLLCLGSKKPEVVPKALAECQKRRQSLVGVVRDGRGSTFDALDAHGAGVKHRRASRVSCTPNTSLPTTGAPRCSKVKNNFSLMQDEMRTRSQRALFEGLANTAEMSRDRWFIVRPWGKTRQLWHFVVSISACLVSVTAPLIACDVCESFFLLDLLEALGDLIFSIDVCLHFITAYQDELRDIIVTSPSHIRRRYMRSWFVVDLFGAFPFDLILRAAHLPVSSKVSRCSKLARVARVLLAGEWHVASVVGDTDVNPAMILAMKLSLCLLLAWHWAACFYNLFSLNAPPMEDPSNLYNTSIPWGSPQHVLERGAGTRYLHALSWAIASTVGTIRPEPNTRAQLFFSDAMTLFGFIAMAWVVGAATTAVADMQHERSEMSQALSRIARYMHRKHLPREIRLRVLSSIASSVFYDLRARRSVGRFAPGHAHAD